MVTLTRIHSGLNISSFWLLKYIIAVEGIVVNLSFLLMSVSIKEIKFLNTFNFFMTPSSTNILGVKKIVKTYDAGLGCLNEFT